MTGTGGAGGSGIPPVVFAPSAGAYRRLTASAFRNSLRDLLQGPVTIGELEPDSWSIGGFASVSAATVSISAAGVEQYQTAIDAATTQAFADSTRRSKLLGCTPKSATDMACFQSFVTRFGRLAWRQPLTPAQVTRYTTLIANVAATLGDVNEGMRAGLQGLLLSPNFLYRMRARGAPGWRRQWVLAIHEQRGRHPAVVLPDELDAGRDAAGSRRPERAADQGGDPGAGRSPARHRRGSRVRRQLRQRALSAPDHRVAREGSEVHRLHARAPDGDDAGDSGDVSVDRLRSKRERPRAPDHPEHVRHQGARRPVRPADDGSVVDGADRDDAPGGWTARGALDHGRVLVAVREPGRGVAHPAREVHP